MKLNISKELALAAGMGVVLGLLALSYASNNNFGKLANIPADSPLYALAQEIQGSYPSIITNKGIANSLASKVMEAQEALSENDKEDAIEELNDLIKEVNAQTKKEDSREREDKREKDKGGKKIPPAEAATLTTLAQAAITQIQNPVPPAPVCSGAVLSDGTCCPAESYVDENGREFCR